MTAPNRKAEADLATRDSASPSKRMHPAMEAALRKNHGEFLRFLARRLGDREMAEEVLQQFYLRVVSRGSDLRKAESVIAWLYTVLRSTLMDHYRKEASRRSREADYAVMLALAVESWDADPELEERTCTCLYEVLPALKPEYSDVLRRVDLSEAPPREVADDLGITANCVRVRLHRARQALRRALLRRHGTSAERECHNCPGCHGASLSVPSQEHLYLSD